MKLTQITLALAALLSTAAAQGLGDLPDCAKSCATSSIPSNCGIDVACICKSDTFLSDIACCVAGKCSQAEQETTLEVAKKICARGGVTDLPSAVVCSSSSAGTATTATTTGASASTAGSSSSAASSAAATTGAAMLGQTKDSSLLAAAGVAAAFAMLV
ncbi:hypothetical protein N7448_009495 [Penicillium atrosanguineum]|uniref:CFEM domain-containing protein n=1 Tax=Penicillium atrosanguineum TaxID=1132637 RepID=A0A9W9PZF8_9EURO|nr:Aflatoxin biosynthesis regulatory protein [Penicillium atrosanguineum]KAJ5123398.1 hypothetical protein N7448_009495 [Penicillium atrosanguineum]KAJ5142029.1 hypothetical protein N7526_003024 [Penicillium atrosanguineum]KAJ5298624.1 Aflatoxin biosynthesis regulatory protein [Penicillium atrosanguineum]KAJ5321111.1 hypothetical protein N7476_004113 [Penicillium atrosanguineum]